MYRNTYMKPLFAVHFQMKLCACHNWLETLHLSIAVHRITLLTVPESNVIIIIANHVPVAGIVLLRCNLEVQMCNNHQWQPFAYAPTNNIPSIQLSCPRSQ